MRDFQLAEDMREKNLKARTVALRQEIAKAEKLLERLEGMSRDHVIQKIIKKHAKRIGVSPTVLKGLSRKREIARARQDAFLELRRETNLNLSDIGRIFSLRDHTTVLHGIRASKSREKAENSATDGL